MSAFRSLSLFVLLTACGGGGETDAPTTCEEGCREAVLRPCRDNCFETCQGEPDYDQCVSLCSGDCLDEEARCIAEDCAGP